MDADCSIRPYRYRQDTKTILKMIRSELVPLSRNPIGREALTDRALIARIRQGRTLVAAGRGGRIEGFIHLLIRRQPNSPALLQIDMLAVNPDSRGRGIGSALLAEAEIYGRSQGCAAASLFVDEGNVRAHRFYHNAGYRTIRHWPSYRCWELHKPLFPVL